MSSLDKEATTQDDAREKQIIRFCGLKKLPKRMGHDASAKYTSNFFEIKSTTNGKQVSISANLSIETINRLRTDYWLVGVGNGVIRGGHKIFIMEELFFAHPFVLEDKFKLWEEEIRERMRIVEKAKMNSLNIFSPEELKILDKVNNNGHRVPGKKIAVNWVRSTFTPMSADNPKDAKKQLKELVETNPIVAKTSTSLRKATLRFLSDD